MTNLKKKFFKNTEDLVQFILTTRLYTEKGIESVEDFLGIEFEFGDSGVFPSDRGSIPDERYYAHDGEVNEKSWRVTDGYNMPTQHPFIFVYIIEKERDRCGSMEIELGDYVYLSDFKKE